MKGFSLVVFAFILLKSVTGIDQVGRLKRIPYEPDNRIPIDIPTDEKRMPDRWSRKDWGKIERSFTSTSRLRSVPRGPDSVPADTEDVCFTKGCVLTAASLLDSIDDTVNPCEDFYGFVCGNWIDKAIIPEHSGVYSTLGEISAHNKFKIHKLIGSIAENATGEDEQIRDFYYSCLDTEAMEKLKYDPLFSLTVADGVFPPLLSNKKKTKDAENILESILVNYMADSPLFGIDYSRDSEAAATKNILYLYQPNLRYPGKYYHKEEPQFWPLMTFNEKYLYAAASELISSIPDLDLTIKSLKRKIYDMINIEVILGRKLVNEINYEDTIKKITLDDFSKKFGTKANSKIDIVRVLKNVIFKLTGSKLPNDAKIIIPHGDYFEGLATVIDGFETDALINYLTFNHMLRLSPYTTQNMRMLNLQLQSVFSGAKAEEPRWSTCVANTILYFGAKVSQIFSDDSDGVEIQTQTEKMIKELRTSFKSLIEEAKWMDKDTQTKALEKLLSITAVDLVYNDQLNYENVAKVYEGLEIMKNTKFLQNIVNHQKFWTKKEMKRIFETPRIFGDIDVMGFDTTLVNAMYSPEMNSIWLPLGIQKPPVFDKNRFSALNYGPLGAIVGHELTHGFDNTGSSYDAEGNLFDWWSNDTKAAFKEKQQCFIKQYEKYTYTFLQNLQNYTGPIGVNGEKTLGENIADNGGMREAFRAYKKVMDGIGEATLPGLAGYTNDQLFFMSYARVWCETKTIGALVTQLMSDPHPPAPVRVKAIMSNSEDFQKAFNCKAGDPMVANPRCAIW